MTPDSPISIPFVNMLILIFGAGGIVVTIIKIMPRLREISSIRMQDAIAAWKAIADRHEVRIKALEDELVDVKRVGRENERKCAEDIAALRRMIVGG